ncbi:hypothetical protein A4G19_01205 [Pasteurellaceae bacterium Macca]|nr:hypothetical protein [Pasteurellaceae bacterium Macca]
METLSLFKESVRKISGKVYSTEQINAWINIELPDWQTKMENSYLALIDGNVAGVMKIDDNYLDLLFIHPNFIYQGVGKALLKKAEILAEKKGFSTLLTEASINAKHFFERNNFQVLQVQNVFLRGQVFLNYKMEKALPTIYKPPRRA